MVRIGLRIRIWPSATIGDGDNNLADTAATVDDGEEGEEEAEPMEISVEPVRDGDVAAAVAAAAAQPAVMTFRSSVELQVNAPPPPPPPQQQQQRPPPPPTTTTSPGQRGSFTLSQPPIPRMQART